MVTLLIPLHTEKRYNHWLCSMFPYSLSERLLSYQLQLWLLYPPTEAFYSTKPARKLFEEVLRSAQQPQTAPSILVVQRAGDVMYVPALWGHATLNVAQSIGVAHEFSVEAFCME